MEAFPGDLWLRVGQHDMRVAATLSGLNLEFRTLFRPRLLALKYVRMWRQRLGFRAFYEKLDGCTDHPIPRLFSAN